MRVQGDKPTYRYLPAGNAPSVRIAGYTTGTTGMPRPEPRTLMIRWKTAMRRGVQIAVSLLAIVLLVRPFDCFANARTREAMDCCLKGKCVPSANADDCCKNTVPAANHILASRAAGHCTPLLSLGVPVVSTQLPPPAVHISVDSLRRAPPPPNLTTLNRPLLI